MSSKHPNLGWSDFARGRHVPGGEHAYFTGSDEELLDLVRAHWEQRRPGQGRPDTSEVVVVPLPAERFVSSTIRIEENTRLRAAFVRRQAHEEGYVRVTAAGPREPVRFAAAVLYSAETLLQNDGVRSGDADWEIVCLLASRREHEPMHPVTMARNFLGRPGGTPCDYTAREFAEAIDYWSRRANVHVDTTRPVRVR